jgi:hypothetical protein
MPHAASVGARGRTPESLPRYSSDHFALMVTVVQFERPGSVLW